MILKLMSEKGTWRVIDNIEEIDYHYSEDSKIVKINIFFYNKKSIIGEIESKNKVYILNNEGKDY